MRIGVDIEVAEDILGTLINEYLTMLCDAEAAAQPSFERIDQISATVDELFAVRRGLGALDPAGVQMVIAFYGSRRNATAH